MRGTPYARTLVAAGVPIVVAVLCHEPVASQTPAPNIWNGVFTADQARQGQEEFEETCARCHNSDLSGDRGPALKGDRFMTSWGSRDVYRLFSKIKEAMPPNRPGSMSDEAYLSIVTHILQTNGFPVGPQALTPAPEALEAIVITSKDGARAIPNFSLVATSGCLAPRPEGGWMLTRSSEPAATKDEPATDAELATVRSSGAGQQTFVLLSAGVFDATAHQGQRMQAKGLLYRTPEESRISLTSLQVVGGDCGGAGAR